MHPALKSALFVLQVLDGMILRVRASMGSGGVWPPMASRSLYRTFKRGLRLVEAYLRRVLLVMALRIEPTLVDRSKAVERRKERVRKWRARQPRFVVLDSRYRPLGNPELRRFDEVARLKREEPWRKAPKTVSMRGLYRRLDYLAKIAAAPMPRAQRLAFYLARRRHGPFVAPDAGLRLPGIYGTEASATFQMLGYLTWDESRKRPPPLPPPKRYGPSVTVLDW
jgi:hypothetical protein